MLGCLRGFRQKTVTKLQIRATWQGILPGVGVPVSPDLCHVLSAGGLNRRRRGPAEDLVQWGQVGSQQPLSPDHLRLSGAPASGLPGGALWFHLSMK